jgi:hypothetical protein
LLQEKRTNKATTKFENRQYKNIQVFTSSYQPFNDVADAADAKRDAIILCMSKYCVICYSTCLVNLTNEERTCSEYNKTVYTQDLHLHEYKRCVSIFHTSILAIDENLLYTIAHGLTHNISQNYSHLQLPREKNLPPIMRH